MENHPDGFLGNNIGPNKDTKNKKILLCCLSRLGVYAGYITINISSFKCEGLRDYHDKEMKKHLNQQNYKRKNRLSNNSKNVTDINDDEIGKVVELVAVIKYKA